MGVVVEREGAVLGEFGASHCNPWGLCDALFSNYFEDLFGGIALKGQRSAYHSNAPICKPIEYKVPCAHAPGAPKRHLDRQNVSTWVVFVLSFGALCCREYILHINGRMSLYLKVLIECFGALVEEVVFRTKLALECPQHPPVRRKRR